MHDYVMEQLMVSPPFAARVVALVLALVGIFGLMFFADYYVAADNRADLLIYGSPIVALIVGGAAPASWYSTQPARYLICVVQVLAIPTVAIAIYRDVTLINGGDWVAATLRTVELALLVLFTTCAARGVTRELA